MEWGIQIYLLILYEMLHNLSISCETRSNFIERGGAESIYVREKGLNKSGSNLRKNINQLPEQFTKYYPLFYDTCTIQQLTF